MHYTALRGGIRYRLVNIAVSYENYWYTFLCTNSLPTIQTFILARSVGSEAHGILLKAARIVLKDIDARHLPLTDFLGPLETELTNRRAFLAQEASKIGTTASSVIDALMLEDAKFGRNKSHSDQTDTVSTKNGIPQDNAMFAAIQSSAFVDMVNNVSSCDQATATGRRDAIAWGFSGNCILSTRMLLLGEASLARKHHILDKLNQLRMYVPDYLSYTLSLNAETGQVIDSLRDFRICGKDGTDRKFLENFMQCKFDTIDWYGSFEKPGFLYWKSTLQDRMADALLTVDHWCVPQAIEEMAIFGQMLFTAIGFPERCIDEPNQGYSFVRFFTIYVKHLKLAGQFSEVAQQYDWLQSASDQAKIALHLISQHVLLVLTSSSDLDTRELAGVIAYDAAPLLFMRNKEKEVDEVMKLQRTYHILKGSQSTDLRKPSDAFTLPRLSDRDKNKKRLYEPPDLTSDIKPPPITYKAFVWLQPNKELLISGLVWDVAQLAAKYKIQVSAVCWPVLLSRKTDVTRLAVCDNASHADHASLTSPAHVLKNFSRIDDEKLFSRQSTFQERVLLEHAPLPTGGGGKGKGSGKGGKGSDGKGKNSGKGGGDQRGGRSRGRRGRGRYQWGF